MKKKGLLALLLAAAMATTLSPMGRFGTVFAEEDAVVTTTGAE